MKSLIRLLKEILNNTYSFGCVMLYFNFPEIKEIQNLIEPEDIYKLEGDRTYGLEDEPHVTLLYGLHKEVTLENIKEVLSNYKFGPKPLTAHNISLFKNKDYDVLKFDVEGEILHAINKDLKNYPFTSDFPNYHPHLTIGYLKSGTGEKYITKFKNLKFDLIPQYGIYSQSNGSKDKIKIQHEKI